MNFLKLKKATLFFFIFSSIICYAQKTRYSFGFSGTYYSSNTGFSRGQGQASVPINSNGYGFSFIYKNTKYAALKIDLNLANKGLGFSNDSVRYVRQIQYLEVPMETQFELGNKKWHILINLGPQFGYKLSENETYTYNENVRADYLQDKFSLTIAEQKGNKYQLGIIGGVGFNYDLGKIMFQLNARYYQAFSNMINPTNLSRMQNQAISFSFGLYYNLVFDKKKDNKNELD